LRLPAKQAIDALNIDATYCTDAKAELTPVKLQNSTLADEHRHHSYREIYILLTVLVLQIILPVALLSWLAFSRAKSWLSLIARIGGLVLFLFALSRVAQWAVPAWWLPRVYWAIFAIGVLLQLGHLRTRKPTSLPQSLGAWTGVATSVILAAMGGYFGLQAVNGARAPSTGFVELKNPFASGQFLVGQGGNNELLNAHLRTLDPTVERYHAWRGQSRALDFFGIGSWGFSVKGFQPADPARYAIFGADLVAPCSGQVIALENSLPDLQVPETDTVNRLGNHVLLRCDGFIVALAHLQQGSVRVTRNALVSEGDAIGKVGNSGSSSEPHLHIHVQREGTAEKPVSGEPLWFRIDGKFLVRGDRLRGRAE
jgi:hypothetical protein